MKREEFEVIRGSGNVFRDLGKENADVQQFKAILAAGGSYGEFAKWYRWSLELVPQYIIPAAEK